MKVKQLFEEKEDNENLKDRIEVIKRKIALHDKTLCKWRDKGDIPPDNYLYRERDLNQKLEKLEKKLNEK
jgi:hypothetical protein